MVVCVKFSVIMRELLVELGSSLVLRILFCHFNARPGPERAGAGSRYEKLATF